MERLYGTGVALVTPFKKDLSIDEAALRRLVAFNIEGGVDYLVVLGTTGEPVTLTKAEKELVIHTVVDENQGRIPLVLGLASNATQGLLEEVSTTDLSPFDAILSVSPYYNKPTQEGIYEHFKALALASPKPIILYNVPGRTASNMLPDTVLRLANDFESIIGIKEASGNLIQIMEILKRKPSRFMVISGDDVTALPTVLAGGTGLISVLGQAFPAEMRELVQLGLDGNAKAAYAIHYALQDGMSLIFEEGNPAGIKAVLMMLELCEPQVRLPLMPASTILRSKLAAFLKPFVKLSV
ncbi:4-hydroxy-tetrahydrodipicolinate synthase [Arenibacter sp. GZD96]|uniref:4-hydroxy-tetrahydrodipicolinate synthase n=1 Tax=Aurantibrevibacter litoralis TaxID=3106030 RepID=UPI002B03E78F|nr:4-hydroxy-tetrahydrodipicolinate synthase [Arenibacter sp. GZD-96]MEA1786344.1 4-hydroxy-tetrahydrodipicolinate synthase [Arenibacter sp. GZD-96]